MTDMDTVIRINRAKDADRKNAEDALLTLKLRPSLKGFMGSKKAFRKLQKALKNKAAGKL